MSRAPGAPLRFERQSRWPRPAGRFELSLRTVLLFLGFAAIAAALGTATAWTSVFSASPWQWRGIIAHFLPLLLLTFLLQWALLAPDRIGIRLTLIAILLATFLAVRTVVSSRARIDPLDFQLGLINPVAFAVTIAAIFAIARWAGWRWVWGEIPATTEPTP